MVTPVKREDKALVCDTVIVLKPWSSEPGQGLPDGQNATFKNNIRSVDNILYASDSWDSIAFNRVMSGMPA